MTEKEREELGEGLLNLMERSGLKTANFILVVDDHFNRAYKKVSLMSNLPTDKISVIFKSVLNSFGEGSYTAKKS